MKCGSCFPEKADDFGRGSGGIVGNQDSVVAVDEVVFGAREVGDEDEDPVKGTAARHLVDGAAGV